MATTLSTHECEQLRQDRRADALASSFPGEVRRLLMPARVSTGDQLSEKLQGDLRKHGEDLAGVSASLKGSLADLGHALDEAETTDNYAAVLVALETDRINRPTVAQQAVALLATAIDLAERKAAELRTLADGAEAEAAVALDKAKAMLAKAGSGVETMTSWPNEEAAAVQFECLARRNSHAAKALTASVEANNQHRVAADEMHRAQRGLADAKAYLRKLVERMIR